MTAQRASSIALDLLSSASARQPLARHLGARRLEGEPKAMAELLCCSRRGSISAGSMVTSTGSISINIGVLVAFGWMGWKPWDEAT